MSAVRHTPGIRMLQLPARLRVKTLAMTLYYRSLTAAAVLDTVRVSSDFCSFRREPRGRDQAGWRHWQHRGPPRLEPADEVRGPAQPDQLQRGRSQRRGIALVTDHDPVDVRVHRFRNPAGARRVQPPFEMVALDDDRPGNLAVGAALELRTGVHQDGAALDRVLRLARLETRQPRSRAGEKAVHTGIRVVQYPVRSPRSPVLRHAGTRSSRRLDAGNRVGFGLVDLEDVAQPRDGEDVLQLLRQVTQLEAAAAVGEGQVS